MPYFWIVVVWVDGFLWILKHFLDLSRYDPQEYEMRSVRQPFCSLIAQCILRLLDFIVRLHCHEKMLDGTKILRKTGVFAASGKYCSFVAFDFAI